MQKPSFTLFEPLSYALKTALKKFYVTVPFLILYFVLAATMIQSLWNIVDYFLNFPEKTLIDSLKFIFMPPIFLLIISLICLFYICASLKWYDPEACTLKQLCSRLIKIPASLFLFILSPLLIILLLHATLQISALFGITVMPLTIITGIYILLFLHLTDQIILSTHCAIDKQLPAKEAWLESKKLLANHESSILLSHAIIDFILLVLFFIFYVTSSTNNLSMMP